MKNRIYLLIITMLSLTTEVFADEPAKTSGELNNFLSFAVKISIWVVVCSVIIAIGLWVYKQILDRKNTKSPDSKADKFTCEIDDTETIDEAINTFLEINK